MADKNVILRLERAARSSRRQWTKRLGKLVGKTVDLFVSGFFGNAGLARRKGVTVDCDCWLYIREFGAERFLLKLGDRITIAVGCWLITPDGSTCQVRDKKGDRYQHYAPITLGNDVFVGINSIVPAGVNIGSRGVVGAFETNKRAPDNSVVAGKPVRVVGKFSDFSDHARKTYV